jgi:hypothetical protein
MPRVMTALEKKVLKAKKEDPPVFREADTIYFAKKDTTTRCYFCKQFILAGKAYQVSTDSRHFKHSECPVDKVK